MSQQRISKDDVLAAMTGRFPDFFQGYTPLKLISGEWRGACPLHGGEGPNFTLGPENGQWYCHTRGCGKPGGDIFNFVMIADGLTFPEALAKVADFAGVSPTLGVPLRHPARIVHPAPKEDAVRFLDPCIAVGLHRNLMNNDKFRCWLSEYRGLTMETLTRFQIGLMKEAGLYRVTFPVPDRQGRLTNIRKHLFAYNSDLTDVRRRELNKTLPWEKGLRADLYPLSVLEGATEALIVEGEADALLANQMGFPAVTGTLGAGNWKPDWTDELSGLLRVTILYDADQAGQEGAKKVAASIRRVVPDVRIASYSAWPGKGGPA